MKKRVVLRTISGWILVSAAVGALVGLVWVWVAPRVQYRVVGDQLRRVDPQPSQYFAADLLLGGLLLLAGLGLVLVWWRTGAKRPLAALAGLAIGGALAGIIAAVLGHALGGQAPSAAGLSDGATVAAPLQFRSWAMLLWWPTVVAIVVAVVTFIDARRELIDPNAQEQMTGAEASDSR